MTDIDWNQIIENINLEAEEREAFRVAEVIESREENKIFVTDFKNETGRFVSMYIKDYQVSAQIQIIHTCK